MFLGRERAELPFYRTAAIGPRRRGGACRWAGGAGPEDHVRGGTPRGVVLAGGAGGAGGAEGA